MLCRLNRGVDAWRLSGRGPCNSKGRQRTSMRNGRRAAIMNPIRHIRYWSCFWRGHLVWHVDGKLFHCSACSRDW